MLHFFYFFFQILFAVIFSFARMVCGPYLTYVALSVDNPFIIKVLSLYIYMYILNLAKVKENIVHGLAMQMMEYYCG